MHQCDIAIHLEEKQLMECVKALHGKTVDTIIELQKQLIADNVCEADFMTIMVNYAIKTSVNVILHLQCFGLPKDEAIDMLCGGLAASLVNLPEIPKRAKTH